jgi:hypothetical protein
MNNQEYISLQGKKMVRHQPRDDKVVGVFRQTVKNY